MSDSPPLKVDVHPGFGVDVEAAFTERAVALTADFVRGGQRTDLQSRWLEVMLRVLLKGRSQVVADGLARRYGARVLAGPFAGLVYPNLWSEGGLAPKLLGTYEAELHPFLHAAKARGVRRVIDVGCAEGYYAVGLARFLPDARVEAYDIDARSRELCAAAAAANGVAERVEVRERFDLVTAGEIEAGTLLIVDTEGAEAEILGEGAAERLRHVEVIVETHPHVVPGIDATLAARFATTHEVIRVEEGYKPPPPGLLPPGLPQHDLFAATWEWRATQTPWLVMRPHAAA